MDISSLLEVQVQEGKPSELGKNVANSDDVVIRHNFPLQPISAEERHFHKLLFGTDIASVRFRKIHCTACDIHIGSAPSAAHNMHEHPVLRVLLCTTCRNFYGDGTFEQGDDATDMFCRWCANGGNLYCCSYCSNTFCYNCIKRNFDSVVRKKIEADEKWKCFVCDPADLYTARAVCWALLQHVETVTKILRAERKMSPKEIEAKMNLDESKCCLNRQRRKQSETLSDDEEQDETYHVSRKKRRRLFTSKKKRRSIKREDTSNDSNNVDENHPASPFSPNNNEIGAISREELPLTRRRSRRNETSDSNSQNFSVGDDDIPAPLLECDQTMVEGAESLNFDNCQEIGSGENFSVSQRGMGITTVPMINLLRRPPLAPHMRGGTTRRVNRGLIPTSLLLRKITPALSSNLQQQQQLPMVTIPSINHIQPTHHMGKSNTQTCRDYRNRKREEIQRAKAQQSDTALTSFVEINAAALMGVTVKKPARTSTERSRDFRKTRRTQEKSSFGARSIQVPATNKFENVHQQNGASYMSVIPHMAMNQQETISPNLAPMRTIRARTIAPPPMRVTGGNASAMPSVIDLDSDPEESIVVAHPTNSPAVVIPDVIPDPGEESMTIISSTPAKRTQDEGERTWETSNEGEDDNAVSLMESVMSTIKMRLRKLVESALTFSERKGLLAARTRTRAANRVVKRTITELTSLNEDLLQGYRDYRKKRTKNNERRAKLVVPDEGERISRLTGLHMVCTRDSDLEVDPLSEEEELETGDNKKQDKEIIPFGTKVERASQASPATKDESVQVYDVRPKDCETSIGYALLLKADYDPHRERDILRPTRVPDENFGKYEEQFINFLQHVEDHGIETEESKELQPTCETILINDLVEADISTIIKELSESGKGISRESIMDGNLEILEEHVEILTTKSITSEDSDHVEPVKTSEDGKAPPAATEKTQDDGDASTRVSSNPEKTDNPKSSEANDAVDSSTGNEKTPEKSGQAVTDEETVLAVKALIEDIDDVEPDRAKTTKSSWKPLDSDDECTILD